MAAQATSRAPRREQEPPESPVSERGTSKFAVWLQTWLQVIIAEILHLFERRRDS
jgi:hypothetical protein